MVPIISKLYVSPSTQQHGATLDDIVTQESCSMQGLHKILSGAHFADLSVFDATSAY
jgi:hypothetical protein